MDSFARTARCGAHRRIIVDPAVGLICARQSMEDSRPSVAKGRLVCLPDGGTVISVLCFRKGFLGSLSLPLEE